MLRFAICGMLASFFYSADALAVVQCEKGFQPRGEICIRQSMADYIACIEASGGNKLEIDHEVDTAIADAAKGSVSGEGKGVILSGKGAAELSKNAENKITDHLKETFQEGAMRACEDVLKLDHSENSSPPPAPTTYNWRKDAERLAYIYSGRAYCDKYNKNDSVCINIHVGDFTQKDRTRSYFNVLTVTANTISVHTTEFKKDILDRDITAVADIANLQSLPNHATGSYYDGTPDNSLVIECISGECIRWSGWQYGSPSPGKVEKYTYNGQPVISYMNFPLANNTDDDLILEMRQIFARLISDNHSDTGEIACKLLCTLPTCPWITHDCDAELAKLHNKQ